MMTRINCVPVDELCDKHLVAEYRELPRVFKLARPGNDIPETYRMGTGHVKFFYNKLYYVADRWTAIRNEMRKRGFKVNIPITAFDEVLYKLPDSLFNYWQPDQKALNANRARLAVRMEGIRK